MVTGAGSGIGLETAKAFCEDGASVLAFDLDETELLRLQDKFDGRLLAHQGDVRSFEDLAAAVGRAEEEFGGVTTLCTCAGIYQNLPFHEVTDNQWQRMIDINLGGVFNAVRAVIPSMRRVGEGSIINLASANSMVARSGESAYSASKGAVLMLTKALAVEYAPEGIRVNAICPGFVDTPMIASVIGESGDRDELFAEVLKTQPLGIGRPEHIARVACFLASDESVSMTGAAVAADGGFTAQ